VWIVGAVPDQKVRELLGTSVQDSSPTPARVSLFSTSTSSPGSWNADEDALRSSAFLDARYDGSDHAEALRDAVMDHFPPDVGEDLFVAVVRRASPFSALAYALGPDATLRLPGWFGEFLLDAGQVGAQLPATEETLALTGTPRRDAIERIHAWTSGLGDDPAHDAEDLLDGPLRVLRHAARTGQGAAGQVRWY
jgi:hypothetical protein